ncbi:unnamed protein product [Rotaria magnacalcarata]|uniref:Homospermidine synthase n=2 Tax=Rotaria magnacalcarata TaxID=392030 RepID=A0A816PKE3_9BILA|nr:unnamed protein product [Rotaria magnacalcarata]CAF2098020.1 unnamed protein product [Rotaria magnacalcarata]CAF3758160.1 unnamed protein product [Rotaria magnacalcarata]CAF3932398.1 unnamed protein product [Rotaria magnacalcarata]
MMFFYLKLLKNILLSQRLLVIGYGSVSQCTLPLLIDYFLLKKQIHSLTIIDVIDQRARIEPYHKRYNQINYQHEEITVKNYGEILGKYLSDGDILLDLAVNLETRCLLKWCHDHKVCFVNTSVELWDPFGDTYKNDPRLLTLYHRQMQLIQMQNEPTWNRNGPTAVLDHGCNPGLVSHFVKRALIDMAQCVVNDKKTLISPGEKSDLQKALKTKDYPQLAYLLDIKAIHISERDTQITNDPKKVNEFVNTWSIDGLAEEAVAPAEMGWGTHEKLVPEGAFFHDEKEGPCNQICLTTKGMNTWVRSWVPSGEIIGMVIRHGEAYGISKHLTVHSNDENNNAALYRPTVHYAYLPSDSTINSLVEFRMHNYQLQPKLRILNNEITQGADEVGVLLLGGRYVDAWWTGSVLDIHEARKLAPGQSATTLQVAISVVSAINYCIKHPSQGICLPDDIDVDEILDISIPYLGQWISKAADWPPKNDKIRDDWQFTSFQVVD